MPRRIIIVGGVAGGATAAARARRIDEHAEITIVERSGYVSFANCGMPYFIGGEIKDRGKLLLQTPEGFWNQYRVCVLVHTEATSIDRGARRVTVRRDGIEHQLPYDSLVLAQGGAPLRPVIAGLPVEHAFTLRLIEDMDRIDSFVRERKPTHAVVAGGGFIGLEMAEALVRRGLHVTVVEKAPQVLPLLDPEFAGRAREHLLARGIRVLTASGVTRVGTDIVELDSGEILPAQLVLLAAGIRPELELARASGLEIGPTGGVRVDDRMCTNDPAIFALGDMAEIHDQLTGLPTRIPLAGPANRQARVVGTNVAGGDLRYRGANGTSVIKLFDRTVASTGFSLKAARAGGFDAAVSRVHVAHHASYYPGAKPLDLALVYERATGRVLGAQAFGEEDVDKRIDVVSTAIKGRLTVTDLEELDLAYAPPYNSANDAVNIAAFAALNDERGLTPVTEPDAITAEDRVLDVRNPSELTAGVWPGSMHIPFPELRDRLSELPIDRRIAVHCQVGRRGHLAVRILRQRGWNAVHISGGWETMRFFAPLDPR